MNYLERYRNGECVQVWEELQTLGSAVREEPVFTRAQEVATETMRRVRRNCKRIVERLHLLGYDFNTFPDGTPRSPSPIPLLAPSEELFADCSALEEEAGPLPLSLVAFWQEVGAIDLTGKHATLPDGLDPLVVDPPEGALATLYEAEDEESDESGVEWFAGLAPDDLHKDNTSGGDPYGLFLPNASVDFTFLYERHKLLFVPYLRLSILQWGGLPGLEGQEFSPTLLDTLIADLEPF